MDFWLNYFSLASLINVIFFVPLVCIIILRRKASVQMRLLGFYYVSTLIIGCGYTISQSFIDTNGLIGRILTILCIPLQYMFLTQFLFRYPQLKRPKVAKWFLFVHTMLGGIISFIFVREVLQAEVYYNFPAHYYEFQTESAHKLVGLFLLSSLLFSIIYTSYKSFQYQKEDRIALFYAVSGMAGAFLLPATFNVLSKVGLATRSQTMNALCFGSLIGNSLLIVGFLNWTKDRTTFMFKVVGISFVMFLLAFNAISYFFMQRVENLYDTIQRSKLGEFVQMRNSGSPSAEVLAIREFTIDRSFQKVIYALAGEELQQRRYQLSKNGKKAISFLYRSLQKQKVYEVSFSYRAYRKMIHNEAKFLLYVIVISSLLIILLTPIFLRGSLWLPLQNLISGIRNVQKGNLDTHIPVHVEDEIGYLSSSFNKMTSSLRIGKAKLKEYSETLEEKVLLRTQELNASLEQVHNLKKRQDGDYFLTTLLLNPLFVNAISSDNFVIEFFTKQKKQFSFNKKEHAIGGDLCMCESIALQGRKYHVFLNADAMGKSLQGAGGILVLGAVFRYIILQSHQNSKQSPMTPEIWIKDAFWQMHKIFTSFEGSMFVSLIFGLVEEDSQMVYYVNAEHPWIVLWRDHKASFASETVHYRKLGTPGMEKDFQIAQMQMQMGDVLLIGSDGKDDLLAKGDLERNINDDETLFLRMVEKAQGDLQAIYDSITEIYELIDDFSLLAVSYPPIQKDPAIQ
ncbi:MAG: SpoIIE family protein phosphatase [Spirochaetota bacterium]